MLNKKIFAGWTFGWGKTLEVIPYILLLINVMAVPLFFYKGVVNYYVLPKEYLFMALILLNLLFFAIRSMFWRKIFYRQSILDYLLFGFLFMGFLSAVLSVNIYDSFLGRSEYFAINFIFFVFLALFYLLLVNYLDSPFRWRLLTDVLSVVGGLTAVWFILRAVFKISLPGLEDVWNPLAAVNGGFGLWIIAIFVLAAGQLIKSKLSAWRTTVYFSIVLLCLTVLIVLSFSFLWKVWLVGLFILLLLGVSVLREARTSWLSALFAFLIMAAIFVIFDSPRSWQAAVPAEVSLGPKTSWSITTETILSKSKNFILGSGLGSFGVDFSQFRPADFNYNNLVWSARFNQPFSSWLALAAEGGLAVLLLFIFLILFVLGHVFQSWLPIRKNIGQLAKKTSSGVKSVLSLEILPVAAAWLVLTIGLGVVFYGVVLWWLWWLLLGLLISGLHLFGDKKIKMIKEKQLILEDTPQYNLAFSFVLILAVSLVVIVGIVGARFFLAETVYANALRTSDERLAEVKLKEAVSLRSGVDVYHAALAKIYLLQAVKESQLSNPDVNRVTELLSLAVNEARRATEISPYSVAIWENLALMYENAALLVPGADEWAVKSLEKAAGLEPTNPILVWRLANSYARQGNQDKTMENYKKAIELKRDYLAAYAGLTVFYEQMGKIDEAIDVYQQALPFGINNVELLFNYGRLLYNRRQAGDLDNAEAVWKEAVRLQPNYSNGLYSLGLLYELKGEKAKALEYYYKVRDLNPDNQEVVSKIEMLLEPVEVAPVE